MFNLAVAPRFSVFGAAIAAVVSLSGPAATAAPCDVTKTVTRNFVWSMVQTTGDGLNNTSVFRENNGPSGNVVAGSATLAGNFTFDGAHTPPAPFCARLDPLPTAIGFSMTGLLDGSYSDSTLNAAIGGFGFVGVTQVTANINPIGAFTGVNDSSPGFGDINETKSAPFTVGDGTVLTYTGDVAVRLEFGFGGEDLDLQNAFAQLRVSGALIGPTTIPIRYTVPDEVPLPASIALMLPLLLGWGGVAARRRARMARAPARC